MANGKLSGRVTRRFALWQIPTTNSAANPCAVSFKNFSKEFSKNQTSRHFDVSSLIDTQIIERAKTDKKKPFLWRELSCD
jgi:hypothetical protein